MGGMVGYGGGSTKSGRKTPVPHTSHSLCTATSAAAAAAAAVEKELLYNCDCGFQFRAWPGSPFNVCTILYFDAHCTVMHCTVF